MNRVYAQVWRTHLWMTHFGAFAVGGTPYKQTHLVEAEAVIGVTGAPGQEAPQVMDKQIASCGDPSIHETGTTFFTDGTSGWTQQCASQMWPAQEAMIAEREAGAPVDRVEEDYE